MEDVLYRHPAVLEAAVVARPDQMWGETPCAFVTLKPQADASAEDIIIFWRTHLAHFQGAAKDTPEMRRKGVDLVQLLRPARKAAIETHTGGFWEAIAVSPVNKNAPRRCYRFPRLTLDHLARDCSRENNVGAVGESSVGI